MVSRMGYISDSEMSIFGAVLPCVWALIPPAKVGWDMGGKASSPSVARLATGNRRGNLSATPDGASRRSRGIPPVLAKVRRGIMQLFIGKSCDVRVIIS